MYGDAATKVNDDDEPYIFSFYNDVTASPDVVNLMSAVTRTIAKTFGRVNKALDRYRRYDHLWKTDKQQQLVKFEQKQPTCIMFDARLQSYSAVVVETKAMDLPLMPTSLASSRRRCYRTSATMPRAGLPPSQR